MGVINTPTKSGFLGNVIVSCISDSFIPLLFQKTSTINKEKSLKLIPIDR